MGKIGRKEGKEAMGKAGENGTEPFGGKTQTVPENHTAKVHEGRESIQRWMQSWSTGAGNEVEITGRKEGEGSLGKRTGNKSRETCGGPVPIEKQNGDTSHGVTREGRQRSNPLGDITQKSRKMAKEP